MLYHGKVFVCLKDATFQHFFPHTTCLQASKYSSCKICPANISVYTDGGPHRRPTFISGQLFVHPHTTTSKNPVERIMYVLNIALQGVGVVHNETHYDYQLKNSNNIKQVCDLAQRIPEVDQSTILSLCIPFSNLRMGHSNHFMPIIKKKRLLFKIPMNQLIHKTLTSEWC